MDEFTKNLARQIAVEVVQLMRTSDDRWVSQNDSALGPRRHCRVVRELVARNKPGATIVGDRFLLSPAAYEQELVRFGQSVIKTAARAADEESADEATAIRARLTRKMGAL